MKTTTTEKFKSGFVCIAGPPNAGKSTLLNCIIGEKIAIVSPKPQTTRFQIKGIYTDNEAQIVLIDTPGIHRTKHQLGRYMINEIVSSFEGVDLALLLLDANTLARATDISKIFDSNIGFINKCNSKKILVLNKLDKLDNAQLLELTAKIADNYKFDEIVPVSALKGHNVKELIKVIKQYLPSGEKYYDDDTLTDLPEEKFVSEIIREKVINFTHQEIPHSVTCVTRACQVKPNGVMYIEAVIYVEHKSQRGIIIGAGGSMLKKIGSAARIELEKNSGKKVYIKLDVAVLENWRHSDSKLKEIGY